MRCSLAEEPKNNSEVQSLLIPINITLIEAWKQYSALSGQLEVFFFFIVFSVFHSTQMGKNFGCQKILVLCWEKAACKMEMNKNLFCEYACFDVSIIIL